MRSQYYTSLLSYARSRSKAVTTGHGHGRPRCGGAGSRGAGGVRVRGAHCACGSSRSARVACDPGRARAHAAAVSGRPQGTPCSPARPPADAASLQEHHGATVAGRRTGGGEGGRAFCRLSDALGARGRHAGPSARGTRRPPRRSMACAYRHGRTCWRGLFARLAAHEREGL